MRPGTRIGRFVLERPLVPGASGSTWRARDRERGDPCVVKFLGIEPSSAWRWSLLHSESRALRRAAHPNLVTLRAVIVERSEGRAALVTDLVPGADLAAVVGSGPLAAADVLGIVGGCAAGLEALHAAGVVHGDLHPRNVVVSGEPGARSGTIVDLGSAIVTGLRAGDRGGGVLGFLAPEVVLGASPTPLSDLFSLGCLLHFAFAGEPPVAARETLDALARGEDPFGEAARRARELVPAPFREVAERLLARHPAARYGSASDVLAALREATEGRAGAVPAEAPFAVLRDPVFAGRSAERRRVLRAVFAAHRTRVRRVVVVEGPRGCGRSRLLSEVRRILELSGVSVLFVRPGDGGGAPLLPLARALQREAEHLPRESIEHVERALVAAGNGASPATLDAAATSLVAAIVAATAGPAPPVLVADDATSLDPWSQAVLTRITGAGAAAPPLVIALGDPAPGSGGEGATALRHRLLRVDGAFAVTLGDIGVDATADLLRGVLGAADLSADLVARIHATTGGIPGAIVDTVNRLHHAGRLHRGAGGVAVARPGDPLPPEADVTERMAARIDGLALPRRTALRGLAAFGGEATAEEWEAIARASGLEPGTTGDLCSEGLLRREATDGAVRVASGGLLAAILATTPRDEGAMWALRVAARESDAGRRASPRAVRALLAAGHAAEALARGAEALRATLREGRTDDALRLAEPLLAAARAAGAVEPAAAVMDEAAGALLLARRPAAAADLVDEALARGPSGAALGSLLVRRCEALAATGRDPAPARERLLATGAGVEEAARAALATARFLAGAGRADEAASLLGAVADGPPLTAMLRIRLLNGLANLAVGRGDLVVARRASGEALAMATEVGDSAARFALLLNLARLEVREARPRWALRRTDQALRDIGPWIALSDEAALLVVRASALEALGRWRAAGIAAASAAEIAGQAGLPGLVANALRRCGEAEARCGALAAALRRYSRALEVSARGSDGAGADATRLALAGLLLDRGDVEGATREAATLGPLAREGFPARSIALRLRLARGEVREPVSEIAALLADPTGRAFPGERAILVRAEAAAVAAGDPARGAALLHRAYRDAVAAADASGIATCLVSIGKCLAERSPAHADRAFRRAERLAPRLQDVVLRASVLEAVGRWHRARGESEAARERLRESAALYEAGALPARAREVAKEDELTADATTWKGLRPERLAWVLEQIGRVNAAEDPEAVLAALLDAAIELTGAERGFLVTVGPAGMQVNVARAFDASDIGDPVHALSTSILESAIRDGRSTISTNASEDERFGAFVSVRQMNLRSVLAVPIRRGGRAIGAFYLDNRFLVGIFKEEDRIALEVLAEQAAVTFENIRYRVEIRDLNERIRRRLEEREAELESMRSTVRTIRRETKYAYDGILCDGGAMTEALRAVDRAVDSEVPVLLEGESGTGKELVARAIHLHGPRSQRSLVVVNCAALPESLMESELFGHRRGAFTGAHADRRGQFEAADGGTLFLDEIGELPLTLQPKLLRALQFGEFHPLGSSEPRRADVRVISATNRDLKSMVAAGEFREDLYYRLAVFPVRIPPLRERRQDIVRIAEHLVRRLSPGGGRPPRRLHPRALQRLLEHDWPGNVRELENVLRRAVLVGAGSVVRAEDLRIDRRSAVVESSLLTEIRASVPGRLSPREEAAVGAIIERGRLSLRDMVSRLGISRATGARDLRRLVGLRVLARRGRTTAAFYELAPKWEALRADEAEPSARLE